MFEVSWSELLILAVVTLVLVGPKEMPAFFNTLGRYAGMVRRQAAEFRRHFEDAMREAELDRINQEVMQLDEQVKSTVSDAERAVKDAERAAKLEAGSKAAYEARMAAAAGSATGAAGAPGVPEPTPGTGPAATGGELPGHAPNSTLQVPEPFDGSAREKSGA